LRNTPQSFSSDECSAFYNSDRTAGFRLAWEYYFTARSDKTKNQVLAQLQGAACCGFFPPMKCVPNGNAFPAQNSLVGIDSTLASARVICGQYPNYYTQQSNCVDYYNLVQQTIGGCQFDLGVGFCVSSNVMAESNGCASAMEDYVVAKITPHVTVLIGRFMALLIGFDCLLYIILMDSNNW